ncbi:MAG: GTP-binding protein [Cyanobacteria bacterium M5B4]|nr:GTP-binding protein [Cyanobacteria bacterium KgW148]PLS67931.1 MAG: GTP-binding protein [Cyanobacteria bacterium M5B4]
MTSFDRLNSELHYLQAQRTLRHLLQQLDLTPRERSGLEAHIEGLEMMLDKLDRQIVQIAVFGMVGRGKSSLLNALLGEEMFVTGPTHGITQTVGKAQWRKVSLASFGNARLELIDTPGIDEVNGQERSELAAKVAQQADLILFVVAGDITKVEFEALSCLRQCAKPILLVFNKIDQYAPPDREAIYRKIVDDRVKELLTPAEIVLAASSPLVAQPIPQEDGSYEIEMVRGKPQIADLKLKILEVLDREGKSIVAINSLLYADVVHDRVIERKMTIRDNRANRLIWNGVMTQSIAIAVSPITVIDLITSAVVNISVILSLSKLYGITMTHQGALALLKQIAFSLGGISASDLLTNLGLGLLKGVAGPGGYIPIALSQATIGGMTAYSIGMITKEYLANGATWGARGPKAVVTRILNSLDQDSIMGRIREELKQKLDRSWKSSD